MNTCDNHDDRVSVTRITGETDSMGSEYWFFCQECSDEHDKHMEEYNAEPRHCHWCGSLALLSPIVDYDDGGSIADVCNKCRCKANDEAEEELEQWRRHDDYYDE